MKADAWRLELVGLQMGARVMKLQLPLIIITHSLSPLHQLQHVLSQERNINTIILEYKMVQRRRNLKDK